MALAKPTLSASRRLAYLLSCQEIVLALAGGVAMVAGARTLRDPAVQLTEALFCLLLVLFCSAFVVRLDRGHLRLTMIATQVSAMVLTVPLAGFMGLVAGLLWLRHGSTPGHRYVGTGASIFWTSTAALLRVAIGTSSPLRNAIGLILVALWMTAMNWGFGLLGLSLVTGERATAIAQRAFTRPFLAAFLYFALAAIVMANLMDGSVRGYLLTFVVAVLSVSLTEALTERRSRTALEAQVADSHRYLGYSRALEGTVHSLRHQLAVTKGYLEDALETKLPAPAKTTAQSAKASTDAALAMLDRLQSSASPRVEVGLEPVGLHDIAFSGAELIRGRAAAQRTRLALPIQSRSVYVRADAVLLRDVLAALLINALQAVEHGGTVSISVGTRRGGYGSLTVADTGPGLNDQQRDHLFEPHYTTKAGGTGMGLFTAFGVVREHRGQLIYEGDGKEGAVFTVLIPLAATSAKSVEPVAEPRDGLNPATVAKRLSG